MKLLITGVSHKTAPVEIRSDWLFPTARCPAALALLKSREGVSEALILSTCNRVEVVVSSDDASICKAWSAHSWPKPARLPSLRWARACIITKAARRFIHLFPRGGHLDSIVVGEPQILAN